jgi:hypothetical protein
MASDLLERFRERMQRLDDGFAYIAPNGDAPRKPFSRMEIFDRLWAVYKEASHGTHAYLEDFFAFYDNSYNVGRVLSAE